MEGVMTASSLPSAPDRKRKPGVIDEHHLGRMTLGDRRLEREVLELFVRQTTIMLNRIAGAEPALAAATAHTLKGSARGIGAWRVARAAELLENAAGADGGADDMAEAIAELKAASLEASAAIGARLTDLLAELAREH
jgi:HPt (histidine-containing phosphotransfer) domain-containing protein